MTVHLVGAGPGSTDLITLRAARLLTQADVVIHDRLIGNGVLEMIAPWAEQINVGKNPDGRQTSQAEINRLLIDRARRYDTVVRLKGGDPFVFGRGGEEQAALTAAGISVEVVPGVTSAIAGPASIGVPVTHRGASSGFTVITASETSTGPGSPLNWDAIAQTGTTLIVLMGARWAAQIRDRLIESSMPSTTPTAIVVEATTARQRHRFMTLADLGQNPVPNPAVIVIGKVANPVLLSHTLNDFADGNAKAHSHAAIPLNKTRTNETQEIKP